MSNTRTLPMVALTDEVILPDTTKTLEIVSRYSRRALRYAFKEGTQIFVGKFIKDKEKFESIKDAHKYGVLCNVVDFQDKVDKSLVRLSGVERMVLLDAAMDDEDIIWADVEESNGQLFDAEFKESLYKGIIYKDIKALEKYNYPIRQAVWLAYEKMDNVYAIMNLVADSIKDLDRQEYLNESDWELKAQKLSATLKVETYKRNVMRDIDRKLAFIFAKFFLNNFYLLSQ